MTLPRIAFAAAALALTSTAAFAHTPSRDAQRQGAPMPVAMERTIDGASTFGSGASAPTIWGHAVSRSAYVFDDRSIPHDHAGGR